MASKRSLEIKKLWSWLLARPLPGRMSDPVGRPNSFKTRCLTVPTCLWTFRSCHTEEPTPLAKKLRVSGGTLGMNFPADPQHLCSKGNISLPRSIRASRIRDNPMDSCCYYPKTGLSLLSTGVSIAGLKTWLLLCWCTRPFLDIKSSTWSTTFEGQIGW